MILSDWILNKQLQGTLAKIKIYPFVWLYPSKSLSSQVPHWWGREKVSRSLLLMLFMCTWECAYRKINPNRWFTSSSAPFTPAAVLWVSEGGFLLTRNRWACWRGSALTLLGLPAETTDTREGLLQPKDHSVLPAFNKKQSSASKRPPSSQISKPPISEQPRGFQHALPYPCTATPVTSSGCAPDWNTTTDDDWWYCAPPFPFSPLLKCLP